MSEERKEELSQEEKTEQGKSSETKDTAEDIQEENSENSYEFIRETIKAKPLDKKKLAKQLGKLAGSGAVFGLAAALVFGALAPAFLEEARARKSAQEVQFQNSTEETEEEQEDTQEEEQEDLVYVAVNAHWYPAELTLPDLPEEYCWKIAVNTGDPKQQTFKEHKMPTAEKVLTLGERSVIVFVGCAACGSVQTIN